MENKIREALQLIPYPGFTRDIISFGVVDRFGMDEVGGVHVVLKVATNSEELRNQLTESITEGLGKLDEISRVEVTFESLTQQAAEPSAESSGCGHDHGGGQHDHGEGQDPWAGRKPIEGIDKIIAVGSGKGGVGKSTVSVNLAVALAQSGKKVGLLDADIYGPSIHVMMGVGEERPEVDGDRNILPLERHGVKLMSMGLIVEGDDAMIWRGPMVMKAIQQFINDVKWGQLDILIVDLPPGTGDAQLTLVQQTPLAGAVIVSTPQEISLIDARRAISMFGKVEIPVLGLVENMSYFTESGGKEVALFDRGGVKEEADKQKLPFLGALGLDIALRQSGDAGTPIVLADPEAPTSKIFQEMAKKIVASI